MNEEAQKTIVKIFCDNHNTSLELIEKKLYQVIASSYAPFLLFIECLQQEDFQKRNNAFDGFFINMLNRTTNTFGAMVSLIINGHLQSAEIVGRALSESSLEIQFILKGDVGYNISHYLASYYAGQKWKNNKWENSLDEKDLYNHKELIEETNNADDFAKDVYKSYIESIGGEWPSKPVSISVFDMYKKLDRVLEYRTIYRAMCGQSHQNPEDIINNFLSTIGENKKSYKKNLNIKHSFSLFMCLWAIRYYLESLESLGSYYQFQSVQQQSTKSLKLIAKYNQETNISKIKATYPKHWSKKIIDGV